MFRTLLLTALTACSFTTTSYINPTIPVSQLQNYQYTMKHGEHCAYGPLIYSPLIGTYTEADSVLAASAAGIETLALTNRETTTYILFTKYCTHSYGR